HAVREAADAAAAQFLVHDGFVSEVTRATAVLFRYVEAEEAGLAHQPPGRAVGVMLCSPSRGIRHAFSLDPSRDGIAKSSQIVVHPAGGVRHRTPRKVMPATPGIRESLSPQVRQSSQRQAVRLWACAVTACDGAAQYRRLGARTMGDKSQSGQHDIPVTHGAGRSQGGDRTVLNGGGFGYENPVFARPLAPP